jgi:methionine-rich copper-binding protein CopC
MAAMSWSPRSPDRLLHPAQLVLAAVSIAVALALGGPPAAAHSILVTTSPGPGDQLESLTEVRFDFAGDLAPDGHVATLQTAGGEVAATGYELPEAASIVFRFEQPVPDGDHEIVWDIVAADGHHERGRIPITITAPPTPAASSTTAAPTTAAPTTTDGAPTTTADGTDEQPATSETSGDDGTAAADPAGGDDGGGISTAVVVGAVVVVGGLAAAALAYRSRRSGPAAS